MGGSSEAIVLHDQDQWDGGDAPRILLPASSSTELRCEHQRLNEKECGEGVSRRETGEEHEGVPVNKYRLIHFQAGEERKNSGRGDEGDRGVQRREEEEDCRTKTQTSNGEWSPHSSSMGPLKILLRMKQRQSEKKLAGSKTMGRRKARDRGQYVKSRPKQVYEWKGRQRGR